MTTFIRMCPAEYQALCFSADRYESSESVRDALTETEDESLFEVDEDAFIRIEEACESEDGSPFPCIGGELIVKLHALLDRAVHANAYGIQVNARIIE